jgi:NAD(P)H-dependent FMN reductase
LLIMPPVYSHSGCLQADNPLIPLCRLSGPPLSKPVLIVTYGGHGGNQCGEQLRIVMRSLGTRLTDTTPGLLLAKEKVVADDGRVDPATDFAARIDEVKAALLELAALAGETEAVAK